MENEKLKSPNGDVVGIQNQKSEKKKNFIWPSIENNVIQKYSKKTQKYNSIQFNVKKPSFFFTKKKTGIQPQNDIFISARRISC